MKTKRKLSIAGLAIGGFLTLSPLLGIFGSVLGMNYTFGKFNQTGIADPQALAEGIGSALLFTSAGFLLFPLGIIILLFSLVCFFRSKAPVPPPLPPDVQL